MSKKYPVFVEFSASGKLARIVHKNGKTVAVLMCNGKINTNDNNGNVDHKTLARQFALIHEYKNISPMELDVFPLENNEVLDLSKEIIIDRQTKKEIVG